MTVVLTVTDLDESVRLFTEGFGLDLHLDNHQGDEPWISGRHAATSWTGGAFIHFALYEPRMDPRVEGRRLRSVSTILTPRISGQWKRAPPFCTLQLRNHGADPLDTPTWTDTSSN